MEDKEMEDKLKKSAEEIEVRDFSLVWEDIKDQVDAKPHKRKTKFQKWLPVIASAAASLVLISVVVPVVLSSQDKDEQDIVYFWEDLESQLVQESEFYEKLEEAEIHHVDFSRYVVSSYSVFQTKEGLVKGGLLELSDSSDSPSFLLTAQFYDGSVKVETPLTTYNFNYSVNGAEIEYGLKESYPEDGIYIYNIKASYETTYYYMEYTGFSEDITPFFEEFFK